MVIGDEIINKGNVVDVFLDTSPGNIILTVTGWVKKVKKRNNVSTKMSEKLYVDVFLYHNIPLKDATRVDILNRMYSEPRRNRKFCDNLIKIKIKKKRYTDNDVHANTDPKLQNMSNI